MESPIRIEEVSDVDRLRQVQELETEVWGLEPVDVMPVTLLVAMRAAGAIVLGAFDGPSLVGFAQGFPGIEDGRTTIHSHTLAVRPEYRGHDLGFRLKLAQRERTLALGVAEITWTFDPLQSMNAHFNFAKLGVLTNDYRVDLYGGGHSSFLLGENTDRFWVRWLLASERVRDRVDAPGARPPGTLPDAPTLVEADAGGAPRAGDLSGALGGECAIVHVPGDVNAIRRDDPPLAAAWREATRRAFAEAFAAGYVAEDFVRTGRGGAYVLRRGRVEDFV